MGFFDLSGDPRKKITATEMKKKVKPALYSEAHLTQQQRDRLENDILAPSLGGENVRERGIDAGELKRIKTALETTPDRDKIVPKGKVKEVENILDRNL